MISGGHFDIASKKKKIEELEKQVNDINFWNDRDRAEKVLKDSHDLKMQQFHSLADWGYPVKQLNAFLHNVAFSYCIKKKKDLSDPDYVFCWNVLQACDSIPKGFNGNRKILFSLFKYCPALFEMICVIWGKKCC